MAGNCVFYYELELVTITRRIRCCLSLFLAAHNSKSKDLGLNLLRDLVVYTEVSFEGEKKGKKIVEYKILPEFTNVG